MMASALLSGYFGKALLVDLDTGATEVKPLPESVLRSFIGGAGLGVWLMHDCCPPRVDPLEPQAPLMFVFSPRRDHGLADSVQVSSSSTRATSPGSAR